MKLRIALLCIAASTLGVLAACSGVNVSLADGHPTAVNMAGSSNANGGQATTSAGSAGDLNVDAGMTPVECPAGMHTSVSGTIWDPNFNVRLYNAVVYIPVGSGPLPPFKTTVACEKCADKVQAI